jgi:hypothetical protein
VQAWFFYGGNMAGLDLETTEFKDVSTELSMTVDTFYRFQNTGHGEITLVFSATQPENTDSDFVYPPRKPDNSATILYDGTVAIWARALNIPSKISIQEVV